MRGFASCLALVLVLFGGLVCFGPAPAMAGGGCGQQFQPVQQFGYGQQFQPVQQFGYVQQFQPVQQFGYVQQFQPVQQFRPRPVVVRRRPVIVRRPIVRRRPVRFSFRF